MTLAAVEAAVRPHGLCILGQAEGRVLAGTAPRWWPIFQTSPEARDRQADPIDRWSKRVLGAVATAFKAEAVFPSDGPPYLPFIAWALATGRFWQSPTGMMVHDTAGLMISIRGALIFDAPLEETRPEARNPCDTCADRPCTTACPVSALTADAAYDVPLCKSHLAHPAGAACMTGGCLTRRACPVSQRFDRPAAQSAAHMRAFLG